MTLGWLIDAIQLLMEKNHHVLLYSDWSNASDYKDTPKSFGTVALHSTELHAEAVEAIELLDDIVGNLSEEMKYLAWATGVKVPFLPLHGAHEAKLFICLVLEMPRFDELSMSILWCRHVDGLSIFPKLPVYLRLYYELWERNQRVQDAVRGSRNELQLLENVNDTNMLLSCSCDTKTSHKEEKEGTTLFFGKSDGEDTNSIHDADHDAASNDAGVVEIGSEKHLPYTSGSSWANVNAPIPMLQQPHYLAIRPHQQLGPPTVGGWGPSNWFIFLGR
ncbi:hypothetical protein MHU86_19519 [Fragilaria crotonensis]|nr:hypothetical protein MHU86_19519 [Fragilaria crotonensis]